MPHRTCPPFSGKRAPISMTRGCQKPPLEAGAQFGMREVSGAHRLGQIRVAGMAPWPPPASSKIQNHNGLFGFWVLDLEFGFWIWDFGLRDLGFWIFDCCTIRSSCGRPNHGCLDFGFCTRFGFRINLLLLHTDSGRRIVTSPDFN